MSKNAKISLSLLERTVELFDALDVSGYGYNFCCEYDHVIRKLKLKMQKLELRNAYARTIAPEGGEARCRTCIQYIQQRSHLGDVNL